MTPGKRLKQLISSEGMVVAPGAYDGMTAKLITHAGFTSVYMSGGSTSSSYGYPDFGLLTMTEMVDNAARMADAVDVPIIADADTGYGNELNVYRTVRAFERAGVAAIHIEDQVFPKRCGHLDDKELISLEDYVAKIRAAADARRDPDFVLIARTDARAKQGFEEAVRRCNAALAAGADIAFLEAPQTMEELAATPKQVKGPCLLNVVRGGKTPEIMLPRAKEMGFAISIVPGLLIATVVGACDQVLAALKREQRHPVPLADLGRESCSAASAPTSGSRAAPSTAGAGQGRRVTDARREAAMTSQRTLFDKIWDSHVVLTRPDGYTLLYIDRHLLHDGSYQAFAILKQRGLKVRRPDRHFATPDHFISTKSRSIADIRTRCRATAWSRCTRTSPPPGSSSSDSTTTGRASCMWSGRSRASPSPA